VVKFLDPLIDEQNSWVISKQAAELLDGPLPGELVLDFGDVKFLSSAGLSALVLLHRKAEQAGVRVALCRLAPDLNQVFAATGLDEVFDIRAAP
jgi:anti-anti-sigma factor